jgi:hypothetical protein
MNDTNDIKEHDLDTLALLIWRRWNRDYAAAAAAWRRLFQNSTSARQFREMVDRAMRRMIDRAE